MDAFYGRATDLRDEIGQARSTVRRRRSRGHDRVSARPDGEPQAGRGRATWRPALPKDAWRSVWWRHGTKGDMRSRFALLRVRIAHPESGPATRARVLNGCSSSGRSSESEPVHYWIQTCPAGTRISKLVNLAQMRWRIERDYEELKGELGPRPLRRPRVGRLSPPRSLMHRCLRVPDSRASSAFPPTPSILPQTRSPTRRFPPTGKSPSDLNAITRVHRDHPVAHRPGPRHGFFPAAPRCGRF